MQKKMFTLLAVLSIFTILTACGNKTEDKKADEPKKDDKKELVVGMELAYPPFETTDEKGNPSGVSVDLANEIGKSLGRPVKIENMSFSGLVPALQTKKVDIVISSMTITDERKKTVDFSDPYAKSSLALLIGKNSPVQSEADLNNKDRVIAVKKGTTGFLYAQEHFPNAKLEVFDKETSCVLEVEQGKADVFIYDQLTVYRNWKAKEDKFRANLAPLQSSDQHWGIAIRKDETELTTQINTFLKDFKGNGGFDKIAEKYLGKEKAEFKQLNIPFFF